jgi:hypothetical protein
VAPVAARVEAPARSVPGRPGSAPGEPTAPGGPPRRPPAGAVGPAAVTGRDSRPGPLGSSLVASAPAGSAGSVLAAPVPTWSVPAAGGDELPAGPVAGEPGDPVTAPAGSPAGRVRLAPVPARSRPLELSEPSAPSAPARGDRPRARLTRRGRLVLATAGAALAAALLVAVGSAVTQHAPAAAAPSRAPGVIVVRPGDTLWSIALRIAPDRDPRRVVADLRRVNALSTADVQIGQHLRLPTG